MSGCTCRGTGVISRKIGMTYEIDSPAEIALSYVDFPCRECAHGLNAFVETAGEWSDRVFAGQTVIQKLEHLREEVGEILDAPDDLVEYADAAALLFNAARAAGFSPDQVVAAMWKKLEVNRRRQWENFRHVKA